MSLIEVIFIGLALAMDAFAITIANCATYGKTLSPKKEWAMPAAFAIFQFLMPVIGYFIGSLFSDYLSNVAKFVTAAIFFVLSLKIIIDNVKEGRKVQEISAEKESKPPFTVWMLILQAVATSIDALAVGVTFAVELNFSVFIAGAVIGAVTYLVVAAALIFGKYLGKIFGKYAEWAGAAILLILAVKNLIEGIVG